MDPDLYGPSSNGNEESWVSFLYSLYQDEILEEDNDKEDKIQDPD